MRVLDIQEVEQISGGLSDAGNIGLGLALAGFGTVVLATIVAPMGILAGGLAIIGAGIAALGGAASALPTPPKGTESESRQNSCGLVKSTGNRIFDNAAGCGDLPVDPYKKIGR